MPRYNVKAELEVTADNPELALVCAAEAIHFYVPATGEFALDGCDAGDPDGWVTVEEVKG